MATTSSHPNWIHLPPEMTSSILRRLDRKEILKAVQWVCVTWHEACKDPSMWRCIDTYTLLDTPSYVTEIMCRDAVDRSSGGLDEVTLRSFCSGELIRYVADRAPQLRILRLSCCYNLYKEGLSEVAKKLQNLEELHIICTTVSKEDIKSFGYCCTQLISLSYNYTDDEGDEAALAIAQTMPGLRHLSLCKNKLTNNVLQAILNKCPHLESLDLRNCRNVNLEGDCGKTCAEKIKNLKLPHDPIDGCKKKSIRSYEFGYVSFDDEISLSSSSSVSYQESYGYNSYDDVDDDNDDDEDDESSWSSSPVKRHQSPPPNWLDLPAKATKSILHRLGAIEILEVAQKVCLTWRVVCKHPSMWWSIDMHNLGDLHVFDMSYDLKAMCRHAVDRSYGRLNHINLEYFADVELLNHIAERAPQLRSLRLACCDGVYAEELCEVAKKLPNLEELHMFLSEVPKKALESFGQYCPQLISLTYNRKNMLVTYTDNDSDEEALVIARTMSGLRFLSLFGNQMTNYGLKVILDQCPHLESLDLRQCYNVNLEGALGRTCAQRIKNLKQPYDSTDDYMYDATVFSNNDDYGQFSGDVKNLGYYFGMDLDIESCEVYG